VSDANLRISRGCVLHAGMPEMSSTTGTACCVTPDEREAIINVQRSTRCDNLARKLRCSEIGGEGREVSGARLEIKAFVVEYTRTYAI